MGNFTDYLTHLDYFAIIDLVVVIAVSVLLLIFFKRRNNLKLAILVAGYMVIFTGVNIATAMTEHHALFVTSKILTFGMYFMMVALCVIYQQDLKSVASKLARWRDDKSYLTFANSDDDLRQSAGEIVKACQTLSKNDIGALIIITPNSVPSHILETGTDLNAKVSDGLLQSIFNTKAPLHDGAVVIKDNVILGAGCFLPISQRDDISKDLGTRHRAAIGITEESDVLAIVVSEETGIISIVRRGQIKRYMTPEKLFEEIENAYGISYSRTREKRGNR